MWRSSVPASWELKAQLVFGGMKEGPGPDKERTGLESSFKVFGEVK